MNRFNYYSILFCFLVSSIAFGQSGKIAGYVSDAGTGEALIGVNVVVKNQQLGASTDIDGNYVILNVPPGTHTLEFSYIGYQTVVVEDVSVKIDRTTRIDQQLREEAVEMSEAVVVTADRPIVETDKTFSSRHFEAQEIRAVAAEALTDVLELNAAINRNADGTLSIRGSGSDEINYTINGIKSITTNSGQPAYGTGQKSDNDWKYDINPLAVEQMELITGGFNAEYGNAQAGVVKVVTKDGGPQFSGGFMMEYRPAGKYHWGDYLYSKDQPEWQLYGELDETWYNLYRDQNTGLVDSNLAQLNYEKWIRNHTPGPDNPLGVYDYRNDPYTRYLFSLGGPLGGANTNMTFFLSGELKNNPTRLPTREKIQRLQNYSLVVAYKPNEKHHLKFTGLYQYFYSGIGSGSRDIRWAGLWGTYGAKRKYTLIYDSPREESVFAQSVNYKLIFSPQSLLETTFTHQSERLYALQTPTPGTDRDRQLNPEIEDRVLENITTLDYRPYFTWSSLYNQASLSDFYELKSHFSSQLDKGNLFKAGFEGWILDQNYNASSSQTVSAYIWRTGFASNYKAKSWYTAAYLQDKLEFSGMIANAGLRFDAYNFGADVPVDEHNVFYQADGNTNRGLPEWEDSKTYSFFSPRLGISFPIGERTAFRVQYGHFRSMPTFNQALDQQTFNGWNHYGNPNLKPKLSVNYEVGVQQNLWDTHQLDVVTYYNDLQDQISVVYIEAPTASSTSDRNLTGTYLSYRNNGYGNSRGVEIQFRNRQDRNLLYSFSYSLSQTTFGYYGDIKEVAQANVLLEDRFIYDATDLIAPEDRTHRFNGSLTYNWFDDEGPQLFGFYPLENFTANVVYRLASGAPYFYSPTFQTNFEVESNRRYPLESSTDLKLQKSIGFGDYKLKLGMRILNLFDNQHLTPISGSEELQRWVLRGVTYNSRDYDINGERIQRDVEIYNYFQTFRNIPRQIFFTAEITF